MPAVIVVTRDITGFASAAILYRYVRHYLLEDVGLSARELRFSDPARVPLLLKKLADGSPDASPPAPISLTNIILAGIGAPADLALAEEALAQLKFQGVEVDWFDHRPWPPGPPRDRVRRQCRLVSAPRWGISGPQFLHDEISPDDHRSRNIVGLAQPPEHQAFHDPALRRWGRRWYLLLSTLLHHRNYPWTRGVIRRLAFDYSRFGPPEESLIEEEETRRRWMKYDLQLRLPFPIKETSTRQLMAVADIREESGSLLLDHFEVARRIARRQKVRYTLLAVSRRRGWEGELFSWPSAVGDLADVPGLAEAGDGRFAAGFAARHRAFFRPRKPNLYFFDLAHEVAERL